MSKLGNKEQEKKAYLAEINNFFSEDAAIDEEISLVLGKDIIKIKKTEEFVRAVNILEHNNQSTFITGKAGTGKSTLLKYFRSITQKNVAVLSFTGLAAINVEGQTIHSFFHFPVGFISLNRIRVQELLLPILRTVNTIVIDEISMCRADLIDAIDKSLQIHRNNDAPFGGVQMIFIGDLHQLPPVLETELTALYNNYYQSPYFFHANVFKGLRLPLISLEKIHRQTDPEFISILNNIREKKNLRATLAKLNKRLVTNVKGLRENGTIVLCSTNSKAKEINDFFLNKLDTMPYSYEGRITGDFDEKSYPTERILVLKEGAKLIMIKNDSMRKFVNGDVAIVRKLDKNSITVECREKMLTLEKEKWDKIKYRKIVQKDENGDPIPGTEKLEKYIVGSFEQYPIRLAWAITIHKSQGQTYDDVLIDMGAGGAFTSGQTYVALSRCRTLERLKLKRPIYEKDVILDETILGFKEIFCE